MSINKKDTSSYRQILKSTSIMGGSTAVTIVLRIIRTKVLALLLGPAGIGIIGIYDSITSLTSTIAGMGIEKSGVRQIAEAYGSGDQNKITKTIISLRRTTLISGILGLLLLLLLSNPISRMTFGNTQHSRDLALLSITILFTGITGGQTALVQGSRLIRDLAMLSILGALWGTLFSIPIVYIFGERGIVIYLIFVSAMNILTSWWYSRKIRVPSLKLNWQEIIVESKPLLKLGLVFMSASVVNMGSLYLIRVFLSRYLGLNDLGIYQAAATLSSLYVGFILDAMGRDFYPLLTSISHDHKEFISLVNKQMEIGLLIAVPGILATISLAPIIIKIFYSSEFLPACDILRWQIFGDFLRIITWPMGFMVLARGDALIFFWTEFAGRFVHICLIWLGINFIGLIGTGVAFFMMYIFYGVLIYIIVQKKYGFVLSAKSKRIIVLSSITTIFVFLTSYFLFDTLSIIINLVIIILTGLYSLRTLNTIIGPHPISDFISKLKSNFGNKG